VVVRSIELTTRGCRLCTSGLVPNWLACKQSKNTAPARKPSLANGTTKSVGTVGLVRAYHGFQ